MFKKSVVAQFQGTMSHYFNVRVTNEAVSKEIASLAHYASVNVIRALREAQRHNCDAKYYLTKTLATKENGDYTKRKERCMYKEFVKCHYTEDFRPEFFDGMTSTE